MGKLVHGSLLSGFGFQQTLLSSFEGFFLSELLSKRQDVPVELVQVMDNNEATQKRFLGSPSFRINGIELWDEKREAYSLSCRVYTTAEGMKGSPTVSMLREVLALLQWANL
jgi:hypothetical protein